MHTAVLPTCPKCGQTDQVQKISSLYGLNTKEWFETHTWTDHDGETRQTEEKHRAYTLLGQKLMPPEKPGAPVHPGIGYGIGLVLAVLILSAVCPLAILPLIFGVSFLGAFPADLSGFLSSPFWMVAAAGILLLGLAFLGLAIWGSFALKRRYDLAVRNYMEKKNRYEREELPRWESSTRRWNAMLLCLRDETVFLPGETQGIPLDDLQKYLNA